MKQSKGLILRAFLIVVDNLNKMGREYRARSRRGKPRIREVWASNFGFEISLLDHCLQHCKILSIDTEFPGCIRSTPWGSNDEQLYEDFRYNVTQTKLIQLGITASNESGNVGGSWEFNFSDFDSELDAHNPSSISFLKQNGLDFDKLKKHGVALTAFTTVFVRVLRKNHIRRWITFHGLYDIGYLLRAMGYREFPGSVEEFARMVVNEVGIVRDLKHMARFCHGLEDGRVGLERLGELIGQKRCAGRKHHAGSDSLLSSCVHTRLIQLYGMGSTICDGYLYGLSIRFYCNYVVVGTVIRFGRFLSPIPVLYNQII